MSATLQSRINRLEEGREIQRSEKELYRRAFFLADACLTLLAEEAEKGDAGMAAIVRGATHDWMVRREVYKRIGRDQIWELEQEHDEVTAKLLAESGAK